MALWGNKDLVYSDGTIGINLDTKVITGSGTTFTTAGIGTGDVITVGAGATYGYAVISAITSNSQLSIASTQYFVSGITTVPSGTSYSISQEPIYNLGNSVYRAPESKSTGFSTSPVFTGVFGVDANEVGTARTITVGGKAAAYAVAHSGWVGVTTYIDGQGNFRVKSEVFVAGGIDTAGGTDAVDDTRFPDSTITISTQPASVGVGTTETATFSVVATVFPEYAPLSYQWYEDDGGGFDPISGATGTSVSIVNTSAAKNGYEYKVTLTSGDTSVTSGIATMTVS